MLVSEKTVYRSPFVKVYFSLVLVEFIASAIDVLYGYSFLMQISMASLMPCLMLYLLDSVKHKTMPSNLKFVLLALFFSWIADIFFSFDNSSIVWLFLSGLVTSFLCNVSYIIAFQNVKIRKRVLVIKDKPEWIIGALFFGFAFIYSLNIVQYRFFSIVQIPVTIYALTTIGMLMSVLSRDRKVNEESYQFVLIGAFLFIFGACLSAINIFTTAFEETEIIGGILIVGFYSVGQYLIVEGSLKQE